MIDDEFRPPPECPVFEPNEEEFADPLAYINKIRPIAEKAGICKIRPPPHWQPPFAIDVENFKFTPRVQRINELGIHTRIRLQFIDSVAKFWHLQGHPFKLPHVGGKALDLYGLHKIVKSLGGFQETCKNKQWNVVCNQAMECSEKRNDVVTNLNFQRMKSKKKTMYQGSALSLESLDLFQASEPVNSTACQRNRRKPVEEPLIADLSNNKELAKLQLYGAGPKMVGLGVTSSTCDKKLDSMKQEVKSSPNDAKCIKTEIKREVKHEDGSTMTASKPESKKIQTRNRPSDQIPYSVIDSIDNCKLCGKDNNDSLLLLCDGCDDSYHTYCLIPPLPNVPTGDWRCPKCIAKECNKKTQAYGFEQARKEYTLQSFGEMADAFKSEYFTKPVHMVPTEVVEQEFWRLVGSLEEDLAVEYGADIHVIDNGSGFPRMSDKEYRDLSQEEEEYALSRWNLNNLPVQEQSLLRSISGDISGMKVPWVYVGMCFSAFCWHIEDHWTYSINYMHWGEPKTWYGVPREDANKLEVIMQESAPELFKNHPDLLHHLVTTMNPATLMKHGVRVVRTNQCAGEFMITFPRAYHAGFNQGYNFAEAVNFCPADWVPVGRQCVAHYRKMKKACVFSHEEIICKVANNPERLDVQVATVIYKDMLMMLQEERELRKNLLDLGIVKAEREAFELVPDDERQCIHCRTTCFLSAMTCPCSPDNLVCLRHVKELCQKCTPTEFVLRYRYTLDELPPILHKLKLRAEAFDSWSDKVKAALAKKENKLSLQEIKMLLIESENGKFPENDLLQRLKSVIHEAEICSRVAQQLVSTRKHRTRIKDPENLPARNKCTLTLEEIQAFCKQLQSLPCAIPCVNQVSEYTKKIESFIQLSEEGLAKEEPSSEEIISLLEDSTEFDLDLPQIPQLHQALRQAKWLEEVRQRLLLDDDDTVGRSAVTLDQLRRLIDSGVSLHSRRSVQRAMAELQELLTLAEGWEEKAQICLTTRPAVALPTAMMVIEKARQIPVCLPRCLKLEDVIKKAKMWLTKVEKVQAQDYYPYIEVLEALAAPTRSFAVKLEQATLIESQLESAKNWKERTAKIFLKKNSAYTLLEVLKPRSEVNTANLLKYRRKRTRETADDDLIAPENVAKLDIHNPPDPVAVVASFKEAEAKEIELIRGIQEENDAKVSGFPTTQPAQGADESPVLYCICRKPSSGLMLQCEVCHDWFHTSCVPLPKLNSNKSKVEQVYELKFLCPLCHRTRRPHLSSILSLLLQLQKLPVRIQEGEALQCLTERAMSWQDKAKKVLSSEEHKNVFEHAFKLSGYGMPTRSPSPQRDSDNLVCTIKSEPKAQSISPGSHEGRNSIDDAIDAVIQHTMKQADDSTKCLKKTEPLLSSTDNGKCDQDDTLAAAETLAMISRGPASSTPTSMEVSRNDSVTSLPSKEDNASPDKACSVGDSIDDYKPSIEESDKSVEMSGEDANLANDITDLSEKDSKKEDEIELSPPMQKLLEDLMLEGDLLEVTLPETQIIWKILQIAHPRNDENFISLLEAEKKELKNIAENGEKNKKEYIGEKRKKHKSNKEEKKNKVEKKRRKNEPKQVTVSTDDDEYAFCSVELGTGGRQRCLQPVGNEVNWLQCDGGCEEWFHCVCVNVSALEARDCEYVCDACKRVKDLVIDDVSMKTDLSNPDVDVVTTLPHTPPTVPCAPVTGVGNTPVGQPT